MGSFFLTDFKLYLAQVRHLRPTSIYKNERLALRLTTAVNPLTKEGCDSYIYKFQQEGKSSHYLHDLSIIIRILVAYFKHRNIAYDQKLETFPIYPKGNSYKGILSDSEVESIISYKRCGNETKIHHRMWTLFFSLLAYTGMRPGELAKCNPEHIDWGRQVFTLESSMVKTNKPRLIPIPSILVDSLKDWVKDLPLDHPIFYTRKYKRIVSGGWFYAFDLRLRRLGLKRKGITLYSLRHSFCTRLLEEDVNLFSVMANMGHSNPKTTMIYSHLGTKNLHKTIQKLPVLRSKLDPKETLTAIKDFIHSLHMDSRFKVVVAEDEKSIKIEVAF